MWLYQNRVEQYYVCKELGHNNYCKKQTEKQKKDTEKPGKKVQPGFTLNFERCNMCTKVPQVCSPAVSASCFFCLPDTFLISWHGGTNMLPRVHTDLTPCPRNLWRQTLLLSHYVCISGHTAKDDGLMEIVVPPVPPICFTVAEGEKAKHFLLRGPLVWNHHTSSMTCHGDTVKLTIQLHTKVYTHVLFSCFSI